LQQTVKFVPTSVGTSMLTMLRKVHEQRRIAIFSGPPGIGKTTAINTFSEEQKGNVVVIKLNRTGKTGMGARMVMQKIIMAIREITTDYNNYVYHDTYQVQRQLSQLIGLWAEQMGASNLPHRTIIFDEAQCLSRDAIETLRYWNDVDRCYGPVPIGLVFVGNNEFALSSSKGKKSVISDAVADRARYIEEFDYSCVENDDIKMILEAHGIADSRAISAVIKHYSSSRTSRSLRSLVDYKIPLMRDLSGGGVIDASIVAEALAA